MDNAFQHLPKGLQDHKLVQRKVSVEFDSFVKLLRQNGVEVIVFQDTPEPAKTDAIFPNNWFSTHDDGSVVLYPMMNENRRWERTSGVLDVLKDYAISKTIDLTHFEQDGKYLEGTGSLVLDRINRIAYASISGRTSKEVIEDLVESKPFEIIYFHAVDNHGRPIYHTNVIMSVTTHFLIVCMEAIGSKEERQNILTRARISGKELIDISYDQVCSFCGNVLEVKNTANELLLVMSSRAYENFDHEQLKQIESRNKIIHSPLPAIETLGGGSARCMIAEIFLPVK